MKILKTLFKIITEPFSFLASKNMIEGLVKLTKKYPIILFLISGMITAIISYFFIMK